MKNFSKINMTSKALKKQKNTDIIFVLTGFGLGDLFNFGFHILPEFLQKYRHIHIVTNHAENIFKYEQEVIWHFSVDNQGALIDQILKERSGKIDRIVYLDNHTEFLVILKNLAKKYRVQLSYPTRALINKLVCMEKGFYFNIYIKMIQVLVQPICQIKKPIQLYGKNEKSTHHTYIVHHNVPRAKMNIVIVPESRKRIKSMSPSDLSNIIKWFTGITPTCNIFIVSRNPEYLLPATYHLDSLTVSEVCYFIDKSDICVSVDTGFIHAANFLKKNILGLFGPTSSQSSLYSQENVLEISNIIQKERCSFYQKNVYRSPCVRTDKCIHANK